MSWNACEKGTLDEIFPPPAGYTPREGFVWHIDLGMEIPVIRSNSVLVNVNEWIYEPCPSKDPEAYAKFFLMLHRTPAWMRSAFREWIEPHELYCDFAGHTWRVTGASRLGDIWLSKDLSQAEGYDLRRYVNECTGWRPRP